MSKRTDTCIERW